MMRSSIDIPRSNVRSNVCSSLRNAASDAPDVSAARIAGFQRTDHRRNEFGQKAVGIAEQPPVADGATNQKAQNETTIGIGRIDSVVDQKRRSAHMIGDNVLSRYLLARRERRPPDRRLGRNEIGEQVGLIHRRHAVADGQHSFESRAGIDRFARKLGQRAIGRAIVLLEYDVPDLDVAIAEVRAGVVGTGGVLRARVVEQLGAGTARAGRTHRPKVLFIEAADARRLQSDFVDPDALGFVVADVHRNVEPRRIEFEDLRDELPRPRDRLALVVVPEAEVAEHLEERTVPSGTADALDIALGAGHPQAALHRHHAWCRGWLLAQKDGHERLHPGDGEQRRRHLVWNQARGRKQLVLLSDEEIDPRLTQFLALHHTTL